jgi:hypothetical protein
LTERDGGGSKGGGRTEGERDVLLLLLDLARLVLLDNIERDLVGELDVLKEARGDETGSGDAETSDGEDALRRRERGRRTRHQDKLGRKEKGGENALEHGLEREPWQCGWECRWGRW